jgi:hypothetical protein
MKSSFAAALVVLAGCAAFQSNNKPSSSATMASSEASDRPMPVHVDAPMNNPSERDDPKAPILRVDVAGSPSNPVPVPYYYGYPMYADGPAIQGVRIMRQDNWAGYEREERQDDKGIVYVSESFPVLGCRFEGVQEDPAHYVPFYMECSVPAPADRGKSRPVVGQLAAAARADAVPREPVLAKAFLGEWHATTPGFDGTEGAAYFDTAHGLVGFSFVKSKLSRIAFLFDPAEKRWRQPELWQPPAGVSVGP